MQQMRRATTWVGMTVAGVAVLLGAKPAQAGIDSCGDIHVEAEASCEVVAPGVSCEGMCTPVSVRAACSAQLGAECRGSCDELPSVECRGECTGSCMASCDELEPGEFDCVGSCQADCGGSCEASCEADEDGAACMARCEGACSASCEGSCDVELPRADCEAGCEASCEGSCEVDANLDCQLECQVEGSAECEADVQGGCEVACQSEEGALFCDSSYVDHGDNLSECIDAIEAYIDAHVMVSGEASGESGCSDDEGCMVAGRAEGRVTTDCSVAQRGSRPVGVAGWLVGLVALLGVGRRSGRGGRSRRG